MYKNNFVAEYHQNEMNKCMGLDLICRQVEYSKIPLHFYRAARSA